MKDVCALGLCSELSARNGFETSISLFIFLFCNAQSIFVLFKILRFQCFVFIAIFLWYEVDIYRYLTTKLIKQIFTSFKSVVNTNVCGKCSR